MRKTDISHYNDETGEGSAVSRNTIVGGVFSAIGKFFLTGLCVMLVTGIVVGVSMFVYLLGIASEPLNINLSKIKLSLTSFVYVKNDDGDYEKYQELYSNENRVWVKFEDIPKAMINAQVAIEDKRFWDHNGVDWYRTGGAVFTIASGKTQFGGSTITQQLIKNVTDDNEVSLTRKLREIFRALKLEDEYTKDDIIEAYLNIVNYGAGCRGVQSAADIYFNKRIQDCTIAECAAIAGITQNPVALNPLDYPENNKERRETIIQVMKDQGIISDQEYDQAMKESENMKFVGYVYEEEEDDENEWNWYMDRVFRDVVTDLQTAMNVGEEYAETMVYNEGLNIYCAMDPKAQEIAEKKIREWSTPTDETIDVGYEMMDYEGRVLATVGSRFEKDGRLLWDNVTQSVLQPGSTIKPISSYVIALDRGMINYSSEVADKPVSDWDLDADGEVVAGPKNWYNKYYGTITVTRALNLSSNAAAVSVVNMVGLDDSYDFLTNELNLKHLDPEHDSANLSGLSIGGFYGGATVEEMTAAYQIFVNGGYYFEPYSYFRVTDNDGKTLIDNSDRGKPDQIISTETSTIMNRLLHDVVNSGGETIGYRAKIDGWDIIGKTGTTDSSCDNWFVGASPYALAGIWAGHDVTKPIPASEDHKAHYLWRDIMAEWLKDKPVKNYDLGGDVEQHYYSIADGGLIDSTDPTVAAVGYYTSDNLPGPTGSGLKKVEQVSQEPEYSIYIDPTELEESSEESDTSDGSSASSDGASGEDQSSSDEYTDEYTDENSIEDEYGDDTETSEVPIDDEYANETDFNSVDNDAPDDGGGTDNGNTEE